MARNDEIKLNRAGAALQEADLSGRLLQTPVVVRTAVTADATGGATVSVPYDMKIIDVTVQCTAANASGTLTLRSGTTAITDAIACATNHAIDRAATIDDAQASIATTDNINLLANGAGDRGVVYILGMRE